MEKHLILMTMSLVLLISGCATNGNNSISSIPESSSELTEPPIYEDIDVDLTLMDANTVYDTVYDMIDRPSAYIDKVVKVSGPFRPYGSDKADYCYPAILVQDATACCGSGLEFLLYGVPRCTKEGGNGYPLYDENATIVGRFATYLESYYMYVHLVDALWLKD